jgi:WD40 repeat protein
VAYTRDGRTLVGAGDRGLVHTWDARTGRPRATVAYARVPAAAAPVLSPDGERVAVLRDRSESFAPPGQVLHLGPAGEGATLRLEGAVGIVRGLAFSADGAYLAAGDGSALLLWEAATGRLARRLKVLGWQEEAEVLAVSSGGTHLAAIDGRQALRLWDVATGKARVLEPPGSKGSALAFAPDGRVLACGHFDGGRLTLWDAHTGRGLRQLSPAPPGGRGLLIEPLKHLAFSPDGTRLAVLAHDGTVRVWDLTSGEGRLLPCRDYPNPGPRALAFAPDGLTLAVSGCPEELRLWDVTTGRRLAVTREADMGACFAAVSPDGNLVATACGTPDLHLWDAHTGRRLRTVAPRGFAGGRFVTFSPDGTTLAATGGPFSGVLCALPTLKEAGDGALGEAAAFSPDGKLLAGSGRGGLVMRQAATRRELWRDPENENGSLSSAPGDPESKRVRESNTPGHEVCVPAFSADGRVVAWGCRDRQGPVVKLKEAATGKEVRRLRCPDDCWAVVFCPDGRTLALAGVHYVQLREVASGDLVRELEPPPPAPWLLGPWRRALAVSPDGALLAAAGANNTISLWEIATGRVLGRLRGHHGQVLSLAFTPDGRRLVSGSEDTTALVWDLAPFRRAVAP